jgi:transcriptional repressor NrdR
VSEDEVDAIVSNVEGALLRLNLKEVPSDRIGEAALRELKRVDEVAYIRFASVYREFRDIEDIRREMEELRQAVEDAGQ